MGKERNVVAWAAAMIALAMIVVPSPGFPAQLTTDPADEIQPAWSPDGESIVFLSNRVSGVFNEFDVFSIAKDGTNERLLAQFGSVTGMERFFSPSWIQQTGELLIMDLPGLWEVMRFNLPLAEQNNALPLTVSDGNYGPYFTMLMQVPGGQLAVSPVISPVGSRMAWATVPMYWGTPLEQRVSQIRVYDGPMSSFIGYTDSAGTVVFQTDPGGIILGNIWDEPYMSRLVAFSPDGTRLVFAACPRDWGMGKRRDLYIADLITGVVTKLTSIGDQGQGASCDYVAWSSDNVIAFSLRPNDMAKYDIYTILPDGTGLLQLTNTPNVNEVDPAFSPAGDKIVYASDKNGNYDIFTMKVPK